jgi:hypothetical protein
MEPYPGITPWQLAQLIPGCPEIRIRDYCRTHFRDHGYKYQRWYLTPQQAVQITKWYLTDYIYRQQKKTA